jgi:hypothetical protein
MSRPHSRPPAAGGSRPFKKGTPVTINWSLVVPIAQVVGTVGGLLLVWWKVTQIREVNAYELMRDEMKRFNSPEMRACRTLLARTLLDSRRDFEKIEDVAEEVCGFFEDVGLLLRRRIVPAYFIWSMLGDPILYYGQLLEGYLAWVRSSTKDDDYYTDFDLLRKRLAALARKRSGLETVYSEGALREFLEVEAKLGDGASPQKPRRRLSVACPHCKHPLAVSQAEAGSPFKCPACAGTFTLRQP